MQLQAKVGAPRGAGQGVSSKVAIFGVFWYQTQPKRCRDGWVEFSDAT